MRKHRLLALAGVARRAAWSIALSASASAAVVGCPGTLENPSQYSEPVTDGSGGSAGAAGSAGTGGGTAQCNIPIADVPEQLIRMKCATSSCHDASNPAGELDMISPDVASRLVDQPSSQCPAEVLVDRDTPDNSLLLDKVTSTLPRCGDRMPLGGSLPAEEIACVRDWIDVLIGGGGQTDAATDSAGNPD